MNELDHFAKEQIQATKYLRYVDDFALFSDDRKFLEAARLNIEEYLVNFRLKLHPIKSQLFETKCGANFVGFRILPNQIRVRNDNLRQARQRLRHLQAEYKQGTIKYEKLTESIQSWIAHLKHADTWLLRQKIFDSLNI